MKIIYTATLVGIFAFAGNSASAQSKTDATPVTAIKVEKKEAATPSAVSITDKAQLPIYTGKQPIKTESIATRKKNQGTKKFDNK
ncbi:MAG: putative membrane-anchored protein [Bacteroidia bacterium]|jgi:uncharacterized membrane-anchored protein